MNATLLSLYILIWPALCAGLLAYLVRAVYLDWREAKREGRDLV